MTDHESYPTHNSEKADAEFISDETPACLAFDRLKKINRVCILTVHDDFTIDSTHHHALQNGKLDKEQSKFSIYRHDAEQVLKELDESIVVQTVALTPNVRQSVALIRRLQNQFDVFVNLYDNADEAGTKIVDYMESNGIAFTGVGAHFYDPTRMELKRICRYSQIPTPNFVLVVDAEVGNNEFFDRLPAKLGGFPLFVKPEHGFDSKFR